MLNHLVDPDVMRVIHYPGEAFRDLVQKQPTSTVSRDVTTTIYVSTVILLFLKDTAGYPLLNLMPCMTS